MSNVRKIDQKVRRLLSIEEQKMRAKGATDDDIQEDAFAEMVGRKIADELFHELGPDELKELWQIFIKTASPEKLREIAGRIRAKGEDAYDFELLADQREREGAE